MQARSSFSQNRLSDSGTILEAQIMKKGFQNGPKMTSKANQTINAIFDSIKIVFWNQNGPNMELKWRPKSRKFVDISGYSPKTLPRTPNGGQGAPKWSQNGGQKEPNGEKMEL